MTKCRIFVGLSANRIKSKPKQMTTEMNRFNHRNSNKYFEKPQSNRDKQDFKIPSHKHHFTETRFLKD